MSKHTIKRRARTNKRRTKKAPRVFTKEDFGSGDGMLTSVWGPSLWHYLHTMSFNYPVKPTSKEKKQYRDFVLSLKYVLPCKYCRENLKRNFKEVPLTRSEMASRDTFSRYIYRLHEHINKMLGKKSGLSYDDVRERYEHFRARCTTSLSGMSLRAIKLPSIKKTSRKTRKRKNKKEKGCTRPLYGKKSKCILKIVPHDTPCDTFQMDEKCLKKKL